MRGKTLLTAAACAALLTVSAMAAGIPAARSSMPVLVDGQVVRRHGALTAIDEEGLFEKLAELREGILDEHRLALKEYSGIRDVFERCYRRCNEDRLNGGEATTCTT